MIRFEQVGKRYPNGHVGLHELSFRVRRGEFLFVTGHSGAGKSTLLRLLLAMERPTSGKLLLAGQDLSTISNAQIPFLRRQIGVVFQNHQLLFDRTVFNNVALPLQILGCPRPKSPSAWTRRWSAWRCRTRPICTPATCPPASNSASALPAPSSTVRPCCWRTNHR
jgi:ABC-type ATPase involved in cell division